MVRVRALLLLAGTFVVVGCSDNGDAPTGPETPAFAEASAGGTAAVTTNAESGPGSLRTAVAQANEDESVALIQIRRGIGAIRLRTPITFSGAQALTIVGRGAELVGSQLAPGEAALVANGGGDLTLRALGVRGAPGNGITVAVPDDATGTITIVLEDLVVRGNGLHGVLVNDQAEYFADPSSESADGSDANVKIDVRRSRVIGNGLTALDYDGLRINEGGTGRIVARITDSEFLGNGADGVELDERGAGDAEFLVIRTRLERNGSFSTEDLDDGIDVDEAGDGDILARFFHVRANDNSEQGVDLNENGEGSLEVQMLDVQGSRNGQEGIEFEEDDDVEGGGDIVARLVDVITNRNGADDGDAGLKLREKGPGSLSARLVRTRASNNAVGGILLREDAGGDLDGTLSDVVASLNDGAGLAFEQEEPGTGEARVIRLRAEDNTDGPVIAEGVVVTGP